MVLWKSLLSAQFMDKIAPTRATFIKPWMSAKWVSILIFTGLEKSTQTNSSCRRSAWKNLLVLSHDQLVLTFSAFLSKLWKIRGIFLRPHSLKLCLELIAYNVHNLAFLLQNAHTYGTHNSSSTTNVSPLNHAEITWRRRTCYFEMLCMLLQKLPIFCWHSLLRHFILGTLSVV